MKIAIAISFFASTALAVTCGDKGTSSARVVGAYSSLNSVYDCGRSCAVTTQCQMYAVGGPEVCQFFAGGFDTVTPSSSSPYAFYQKYACDYTTYRVTPALSIPTPTPTGSVCGVKAYDKQAPGSFYSYTETAYTSRDGCFLQCNDRGSACKAFGVGNGMCLLYSATLGNNMNPDSSSPYTYYDMNCFVIASSSSSAVATATPTPTVQATSSTVAPPAQTSSSSASNICGKTGWDKQTPSAYSGDTTANTLALCTASCKKDSNCKGLAFGDGTCLLYAAGFAKNMDADSTSPYAFYDVGCFSSTTPSTPTSSTTSSAPTSTNLCSYKGYESSAANANVVGFQFKPSAGCKSYCKTKSAVSFEQYYDYCVCFSKSVKNVASKDDSSTVTFSDMAC